MPLSTRQRSLHAVALVFLSLPFFAQAKTPNDTFYAKQWHLPQIQAPAAWDVTTGSRDVVVAIVDTGVDVTHEDLRENIWTNPREIVGDGVDNDRNGFVDDVHGWNFVSESGDVRPVFEEVQLEDAWSHGTMVASLIGARGGNDRGVVGVAWNVQLMPLVILDAHGEGRVEDLARAIRYAVNHGADIINFSLVGYEEDPALTELMQRAADAGVVLVAATGNGAVHGGTNIDELPAYPACSEGATNIILGVTGTDTLDQHAPYANSGINCTDIAAPAQEIFGARPSYPHNKGRATSTVPGYYGGFTGTSLAAPLVSGVAALVKAQHPDWTAAQIRTQILATADQIEGSGTGWRSAKMGVGRLNAARAVGAGTETVRLAGIMASTTQPWITATTAAGEQKQVYPYGKTYRGGIWSVSLSEVRWLLWPTTGGGHAVIVDETGKVFWSGFPLGKKSGTWQMTERAGKIRVRGRGTERAIRFTGTKMVAL